MMNDRVSLFQLQHIADYPIAQFGNGVIKLAEQDLRRVTDFICDKKAVHHLPPSVHVKERAFYPFEVLCGDAVVTVHCETTNRIMPQIICQMMELNHLKWLKWYQKQLERTVDFTAHPGTDRHDCVVAIKTVHDVVKKQVEKLLATYPYIAQEQLDL